MAEPAERLNAPLLTALSLEPHHILLDLATGAGEPALTAARTFVPTERGPAGRVLATDLVPAMMAGARRRGADLSPLSFLAADMTALPLADASVDRVSCRFGLMFVPDAQLALAEMRRVLRPGGRAALLCWGAQADNTLFQVIDAYVGGEPALATLFRFATPGVLPDLCRVAGFSTVEDSALRHTTQADIRRPFWRPTLEMAFAPALAHLTAVGRARLETDIATAFAPLADADGRVPVHVHARLTVAEVD